MRVQPSTISTQPLSWRRLIAVILLVMLTAAGCTPARYSNRSPDGTPEGLAVVQVVNESSELYRVSLVYGGVARVLGTVQPLDVLDVKVPRHTLLGYEEFHLVASFRDGSGRRESDQFSFSGASLVKWSLDAARSRTVTLR